VADHVLVTGAGGLIGRALLAALPAGLDVTAARSADVDLLEPGAFARLVRDTSPAAVVHLAWVAGSDPGYRSSSDNPRWRAATREAARAAVDTGVRFIATGSAVDEMPGTHAYAEAKAGLRADLTDLIDSEQVTWLRPHYVFDPDEPSPALLRAADAAQRRGEAVLLREPYARHDFVHVRDVGRAIAVVLEHRLTGVVDIGLGMLTAVHTLVEKFGASWAQADGVTTTAGTDSTADLGALRRTGWRPTETERFLS